jgi:biopolymer transport protein ExbB
MLEIFHKGGPVMYPILFCSVLALGIFLERLWMYFKVSRGNLVLLREVESLVHKDRIDEAIIICQRSGTPLSRIFIAALRSSAPAEQIKTVVESRRPGGGPAERYLGLLGHRHLPLLGLLGTVLA